MTLPATQTNGAARDHARNLAALAERAGRAARGGSNPASPAPVAANDEDNQRIAAFGEALETLRRETEAQVGETDAAHIRRIGRISSSLEVVGRTLIHFSFEPFAFTLGTAALWAHKTLELMEIGHMALHGAYDGLPNTERYQSQTFRWKAPVDEAAWKLGHNVHHHQFTNIAGKDPDLDFGALRLSARIPFKAAHALQPVTNWLSWLGFTTAINMHVSGMLHLYLDQGGSHLPEKPSAEEVSKTHRTFLSKFLRYYGREYVFFPLLAGPFFGKVMLANALSDVARDVYAGAIIYCGHVGAVDFPAGTEAPSRAHWLAMQAEAARDVEVPHVISILCGGLDKQIEHHLFPRMPPNRLREIAPRVREICAAHGVRYRADNWPRTLRSVVSELTRLRSRSAAELAV